MPELTGILGLEKPLGNEPYNIELHNNNLDKIDSIYGELRDRLLTVIVDNSSSNPELIDARISTVKGKTFSILKDRLEEIELDIKSAVEDFNADIQILADTLNVESNKIVQLNTEIQKISTLQTQVNNLVAQIDSNTSKISTLEAEVNKLVAALQNTNKQTATLKRGINTITVQQPTILDIPRIDGRTLVNLLGRDGRGTDLSKWISWQTTTTQIADGVRITLDNGMTIGASGINYTFDATKYYLIIADLSTNGIKGYITLDNDVVSPNVTTNAHTTIYAKISPTVANGKTRVNVRVEGVTGQYVESKKLRVYEIGQEIYDKIDVDAEYTGDKLAEKFPYVDSVQHLINPYFINQTNNTHLYIPTQLAEEDYIEYKDGDYVKHKEWESIELDGSLNWTFHKNEVGFKILSLAFTGYFNSQITKIVEKYDGKILSSLAYTQPDGFAYHSSGTVVYMSVSNTDSGWGDSYTPSADEIKAYFMGWKMYQEGSSGNTPYTSGTKWWAKIRNKLPVIDGQNKLPDTQNNTGYYTPYKLHYKLANPIQEIIQVEGSLMLEEGTNIIEFGEGIVVREKANPTKTTTNDGFTRINSTFSPVTDSTLNYHTNNIMKVFKNGVEDKLWDLFVNTPNTYGGSVARISNVNFDSTATYSVTYTMLNNYDISNTIIAEYDSNLKEVIDSLVEKTTNTTTRLSIVESMLLSNALDIIAIETKLEM